MCWDAKSSVTAWWLLAMMSLFLWYRNDKYDRALSIFVFTLGLSQLIEYGFCCGTDPQQTCKTLFLTLWLQCLVLAIGVFVFIKGSQNPDTPNFTQSMVHTIAGFNLFLFSIIFVIALVLTFVADMKFSGEHNKDGHIKWQLNNGSLLGNWTWLYLIGIFVPLFLIFAFYLWADIGIATLIIYGALSLAYIMMHYTETAYSSMWSYLTVGFAFLAWFTGILSPTTTTHIIN